VATPLSWYFLVNLDPPDLYHLPLPPPPRVDHLPTSLTAIAPFDTCLPLRLSPLHVASPTPPPPFSTTHLSSTHRVFVISPLSSLDTYSTPLHVISVMSSCPPRPTVTPPQPPLRLQILILRHASPPTPLHLSANISDVHAYPVAYRSRPSPQPRHIYPCQPVGPSAKVQQSNR
jgi:hypothetical protein